MSEGSYAVVEQCVHCHKAIPGIPLGSPPLCPFCTSESDPSKTSPTIPGPPHPAQGQENRNRNGGSFQGKCVDISNKEVTSERSAAKPLHHSLDSPEVSIDVLCCVNSLGPIKWELETMYNLQCQHV